MRPQADGGSSPSDARPTLDAERKRITALFSDISGYTAMTARLDSEEVKEITSQVFDGVRGIVSMYTLSIPCRSIPVAPDRQTDQPSSTQRHSRLIVKTAGLLFPFGLDFVIRGIDRGFAAFNILFGFFNGMVFNSLHSLCFTQTNSHGC
jgi:class 3 adenylate cyclase